MSVTFTPPATPLQHSGYGTMMNSPGGSPQRVWQQSETAELLTYSRKTSTLLDATEPPPPPPSALQVAGRVLRYSLCGILGAVSYSSSTAVILGAVGQYLGSNATIVYGAATSIVVVFHIAPVVGFCHALAARTSRAVARDPSGQVSAVLFLRCLCMTVPLALTTNLFCCLVVGPYIVPLLWPNASSELSAVQLDGDSTTTVVAAGNARYLQEVSHLNTPASQVTYALWMSVPANVVSAVAWTIDFASLFDPEVSLVSNAIALLVTFSTAKWIVPHGLWAACLAPCVTFATLAVVTLVGMSVRWKEWAAVVWTFGTRRRANVSPVLNAAQLRNFAAFAGRCVLTQMGAFSASELLVLLAGPRLDHADFAALNIVLSLMFVMNSVDEGFVEGIGTALSLSLGAHDLHEAQRVLRVGAAMNIGTATVIACGSVLFSEQLARMYTPEPEIVRRICEVIVPIAVLRTMDAAFQVWLMASKTVELASQAALSTVTGTAVLVGLTTVAMCPSISGSLASPTLHRVMVCWALVVGIQAAAGVCDFIFGHWKQAMLNVMHSAPSESESEEE